MNNNTTLLRNSFLFMIGDNIIAIMAMMCMRHANVLVLIDGYRLLWSHLHRTMRSYNSFLLYLFFIDVDVALFLFGSLP